MTDLIKTLFTLSLSGGVLTLALLALRPLLRKAPALRYYLCLVVLVRLVVPFAPGGSLMNRAFGSKALPQVQSESGVAAQQIAPEQPALQTDVPAQASETTPIQVQGAPQPRVQSPRPVQSIPTLSLTHIWLLGALVTVLPTLFGLLLFERRIFLTACTASAEQNAAMLALCVGCRAPRLLRAPMVDSPVTIGLLRPRIILPMRAYSAAELEYILLHELTHMRRRDIAYKWFALLAGAMHWFNPVVWLLRREIDIACELSCDAAVAQQLDEASRAGYCKTLLQAAAPACFSLPRVGLGGQKHAMRERLASIMTHRKLSAAGRAAAVLCVTVVCIAAVALGCAVRPKSENNASIDMHIGFRGDINEIEAQNVRDLLEAWANSYQAGDYEPQLAQMSEAVRAEYPKGGALAEPMTYGKLRMESCLITGNGGIASGIEAELYYTLHTDEPAIYFATEHLGLNRNDGVWEVTFNRANVYTNIINNSDFSFALSGLNYGRSSNELPRYPTFHDKQLDLAQQKANEGDTAYTDLETAGAHFLHLSGGIPYVAGNTVHYFWNDAFAISMEMTQPRKQGAGGIWTIAAIEYMPRRFAWSAAQEIVEAYVAGDDTVALVGICPLSSLHEIRYVFRTNEKHEGIRDYEVDADTGFLTEAHEIIRRNPVTGSRQTEHEHLHIADSNVLWEGLYYLMHRTAEASTPVTVVRAEGVPGQGASVIDPYKLWYQFGRNEPFYEAVISGNTAYDAENRVTLFAHGNEIKILREIDYHAYNRHAPYFEARYDDWTPSKAQVKELLALKLSSKHANDKTFRLADAFDFTGEDGIVYWRFEEHSETTGYTYLYHPETGVFYWLVGGDTVWATHPLGLAHTLP